MVSSVLRFSTAARINLGAILSLCFVPVIDAYSDGLSGTSVTVAAEASDNVGVVGVQFLLDGAPLGGEDLTEPYSVTWDTTSVPNGEYTLTATARDAAGNEATSAPVVVTVDNASPDTTPPTVSTTSPSNGATLSGSGVSVTADASDAVGVTGVQFLLDGVPVGAEDTSFPYGITWDSTSVPNGEHTLTARARDAAGNETTSAAIVVNVNNPTVDSDPPAVSTTSPSNGSTVSGPSVLVTAEASDDTGVVGVQFLVDGNPWGGEDSTAPYSINWNTTTVPNGAHTLAARARDANGNRTTSGSVSVTVNNPMAGDSAPPTGSITSPADGATLSGPAAAVTATASDDVGVVGVQFLLNGAPLGAEDLEAPYGLTWDTTTATDGAYTLAALARDAAGNEAMLGPITLDVKNLAPEPSEEADETSTAAEEASMNLRLLRLPIPDILVIRSDANVARVATLGLYIDGQLTETVTGNSIEYIWDTRPLLGAHQVQVVGYDESGAEVLASGSVFDSPSSTRHATADLKVLHSLSGAGAMTIRADSVMNGVQRMELYIDRELIATVSGDLLEYAWDVESLVGTHEILVATYDETGVIASASIVW